MCVSDFITTLLPNMRNMDRIWIGLKIQRHDLEWMDESVSVRYVNFNPLLLGMKRTVKIQVSFTFLHFIVDDFLVLMTSYFSRT